MNTVKIHPATKKKLQRVFDRGVGRVLKQGAKSIVPNGSSCMYRGPESRCCVIGHTIDDEHYDPKFEGFGVKNGFLGDSQAIAQKIRRSVAKSNGFSVTTTTQEILFTELLDDLQCVHDDHPVKSWNHEFRRIAREYGLSADVIDAHR